MQEQKDFKNSQPVTTFGIYKLEDPVRYMLAELEYDTMNNYTKVIKRELLDNNVALALYKFEGIMQQHLKELK